MKAPSSSRLLFLLSCTVALLLSKPAQAECDVYVSQDLSATYDDDAIFNAIASAQTLRDQSTGVAPTLCFPLVAGGYLTQAPVLIPSGISVQMDAPIVYMPASPATSPIAALTVGSADLDLVQNTYPTSWPIQAGAADADLSLSLAVDRDTTSDWVTDQSVGIRIINVARSRIDINRASEFSMGVQFIAVGAGISHNVVTLGAILHNGVGLELTGQNANSKDGYVNENLFLGGNFQYWSGQNVGADRTGVRITSEDNQYTVHNGNTFIKPSFEMSGNAGGSPHWGIPVEIDHGEFNRFESCRNEANGGPFAIVRNEASFNDFDLGADRDGNAWVWDLTDYDHPDTSYLSSRRRRIIDEADDLVFSSGPLAELANPYDTSGAFHIPGVHFTNSSGTILKGRSGMTVESDGYVRIDGWSTALGVFVDTTRFKRFVVRRDVDDLNPGRVVVRAYDANGTAIELDSNGLDAVLSDRALQKNFFHRGFIPTSDVNTPFFFTVADEVKKVAVMVSKGNPSSLRIRSFSIYGVDGPAASWTGYEQGFPGAHLANDLGAGAEPCDSAGRISFREDPVAGGGLGWICAQDVSAGQLLWRPFGTIN